MKKLLTTLLFACVIAFSYHASAVTVTPDTCVTETDADNAGVSDWNCWTGSYDANGITLGEAATMTGIADLVEFYKSDDAGWTDAETPVHVPQSESGTYQANYGTTFYPSKDATDATIFREDVSDYIDCTACFIFVKDGNMDPSWYLINIGNWDGIESIYVEGFWPDNGAISHVTLYGIESDDKGLCSPDNPACNTPAVPIPAAVWLFGSGLIGLVGIARRKA